MDLGKEGVFPGLMKLCVQSGWRNCEMGVTGFEGVGILLFVFWGL
jgi:hypothetical protein